TPVNMYQDFFSDNGYKAPDLAIVFREHLRAATAVVKLIRLEYVNQYTNNTTFADWKKKGA
ncbi:hypothetical protein HK096_001961, partial [Nowakowskiella sp. JEL0078]